MGSSGPNLRKKVTLNSIRTLYKKGEPIAVLTAHDFPSGHVADAAGMEIILVGDSLAMVAMGMEDTSEVLLEEMLLHCRSVSRAAKTSFVVSFPRPPNRLKANHYPRLVTCLWDRMRSPLSKH
jgi:3-methyl-2-oxobutanoate hydroxymethyltransferase